ncbi:TetR family transcriptional regulator [Microbacteriaceae bacterium VKM Ac-2855]|nr:TetR family transcriptional regulator [Microbacteriaceae bacterium VKM Ac-2855]
MSAKLHDVNKSATLEPGLRERQATERRAAIAQATRTLAAERGLNGFTVEELCEQVGISRRTFFNYFASKEHALIGRPEEGLDGQAALDFIARTSGKTLIDDLITIGVAHFTAIGLTPESANEFQALAAREPKLLTALMELGSERDRMLTELIAEREGLHPDDPSIALAIHVTGAVMRTAMTTFLSGTDDTPLEQLARDRLAVARRLFTS